MVSAASDNTLTTNPVEENLVGASFASASMIVKLFCYINSPTVYRGSKSPALAGDLPLYSSFLSYLPLSRFSLASSRYDGNRRGHAHFAGARRRSSGFAAL